MYVFVQFRNVLCGRLHCKHKNERLEFGMETVSIIAHSFITYNKSTEPCRTVIVDLGLNDVDPGLIPNGAKCGENKVCIIIIWTVKIIFNRLLYSLIYCFKC